MIEQIKLGFNFIDTMLGGWTKVSNKVSAKSGSFLPQKNHMQKEKTTLVLLRILLSPFIVQKRSSKTCIFVLFGNYRPRNRASFNGVRERKQLYFVL
jgi:hypothetical protein